MNESSVVGKLLFEGKIVLETPLLIGGGTDNDGVDISVVKDTNGNAYIPATSLAGVLRHYFYNYADWDGQNINDQLKYLWGDDYENDDNTKGDSHKYQSALFVSDAYASNDIQIRIRDGVKIGEKGVVEKGAKYDYEVVERGASFALRLEVNIREEYDKHNRNVFEKVLVFLIRAFESGEISIGAMTTKGFGRCKLIDGKYYKLDFSKKDDVVHWLDRLRKPKTPESMEDFKTFGIRGGSFVIDSWFSIKNSLIVRSYSGNPKDPDAVHISGSKGYILPGTSIRGAIRHRAKRIVKTLGGNERLIITQLFGDVHKDTKEKVKSRVTVDETLIEDGITSETQSRIKIDRFTGGTVDGALFDNKPLWPTKPRSKMVHLKFLIDDWKKGVDDWQAGLLLLVLKDLWSSDLAIGGEKGIGRGVLEGLETKITFDGRSIYIKQMVDGSITIDSAEGNNNLQNELGSFVDALIKKCKEDECHAG